MSFSNLRTLWFTLLLLAFGSALSACGATPDDDDSAGDDDDAADDDDDSAGDDDDSAGDDDDSAGDDDDAPTNNLAYILTTDYVDTVIATHNFETDETNPNALSLAAGDVVMHALGADLWVVDRTAGTASVYADADLSSTPSLEVSFGEGTNPHDVVDCGPWTWVSLYENNAVIALDDAGNTVGAVSVESFADADGGAEPSSMVCVNDTLWVALQRYDFGTYANDEIGQVVTIDTTAVSLLGNYPTQANPTIRANGSDASSLLIQVGGWGAPDGSIGTLDLANGEYLPLVDAMDLGGSIGLGSWRDFEGRKIVASDHDDDNDWETPTTGTLTCVETDGAQTTGSTGIENYIAGVGRGLGLDYVLLTPPWTNPKLPHGIAFVDANNCLLPEPAEWTVFGLPAVQMLTFQ